MALQVSKGNIDRLLSEGIRPSTNTLTIEVINNVKIGFLAFAPIGEWSRVVNFYTIQKVKERVDILIVSMHAGEEYRKTSTPFQNEFAKTMIEGGADIVVGHHPHVVQPIEEYKDGWIFYSLGNFVFDQDWSEETMIGQMIEITILGKKIIEVKPYTIKINKDFQPEL